MPLIKLPAAVILACGLLLPLPGRAQSRPGRPGPQTTDVQVRIIVPPTLVAIKDYAAILLSKDQDRLRKLTDRRKAPAQEYTFPVALPKSWVRKLMAEN